MTIPDKPNSSKQKFRLTNFQSHFRPKKKRNHPILTYETASFSNSGVGEISNLELTRSIIGIINLMEFSMVE